MNRSTLHVLGPDELLEKVKAALGARFTCTMHPEVAEAVEGSCPRCGMPLVPRAR